MRRSIKFLIIFSMFAAVIFALAWPTFAGQEGTAVSQPLAPAIQTGVDVVTAEGRIEPLFFSDLSFQVGGIVTEILVEEGETVSAGDALLRLESTDFEINLQQAEAQLISAQAGLTAAQNQLLLAQAAVGSAQSDVTAAQANLTLTEAGPTPQQIAEAESNVAAAEASLVQASGSRNSTLSSVTPSQIRAAEANLASATAELRALEDNYQAILDACFETPDGNEVCPLYGPVEESTRAQLEVARANQEAAQVTLDSLRTGPTAAQRRLADSGVTLAEANLQLAQAQLAQLMAGPTPEEVAIAEVNVAQAEVGLKIAQASVAQAEAAVIQSEAGVTTAEAAVEAAQAALDRLTLRAPFAGEVAQIGADVGELVSSGVPVVTVADFGEWHVKTVDLTELDIALVEVGDEVEVEIDALPNETVMGEVIDIDLLSTISRGDVVYEVTIRLEEDESLPLRWGMTVLNEIDVN